MSMKNTMAHGDDWHLYEEFGENDGVFLRVGQTTLFLKKDILRAMLPYLEKLSKASFKLMVEEDGNTEEAVEAQIKWLEGLSKQIKERKRVPEGMTEVSPGLYVANKSTSIFAPREVYSPELDDWLPEDEENE